MDESEWPPYTRDQPNYYIFNAEKNGIKKGPRTTPCAFWNEFLPRLKGVPGTYPTAPCSQDSRSYLSPALSALYFPIFPLFFFSLPLVLRSIRRITRHECLFLPDCCLSYFPILLSFHFFAPRRFFNALSSC